MAEETAGKQEAVIELRKACRQFAMQYFHFCKVLVEQLGLEAATPIIRKAVFELALDRSEQLRAKALAQGLDLTPESFMKVTDLPFGAWSEWTPCMGGVRCPYAEAWLGYFPEHPWFQPLASLYCDVIDTTNIEHFSKSLTHRITHNLLWGDESCERRYFPSDSVSKGVYTYGEPPEK